MNIEVTVGKNVKESERRCYYCDNILNPNDIVYVYRGEKENTYVCKECFEKDFSLFGGWEDD